MKEIVVINGSGGVGKDTFCEFCSQEVPIINYSSVKEIKELATITGWSGGKEDRDRKFLADLKVLTGKYNDYPYRCIMRAINNFREDSTAQILFIHIRNIPEIERLVQEFPHVHTLLIRNPRIAAITSNTADADVENYGYEYVVENSGTLEDLKDSAKSFIQNLAEGQK